MKENLRIIGAITAKDLLEALKNKSTLANILVAFVMMVVYKELPKWEQTGQPPSVLVYDAGSSALVERLEASSAVDLYEYPSREVLEEKLSAADERELGIIIPADFDQQVEYYTGIADMYRLQTAGIRTKRVQLIGFTGKVTYYIDHKAPPDLVFQMNLLADYAFFCGTGRKTTIGMGQTVRIGN